ncbi:MAG: hypothetical protein M1830_007435 [Pleopsidium flavum]|nr:MAG: hypothetical protein M1830_007435 [Pleopsidium flavum]
MLSPGFGHGYPPTFRSTYHFPILPQTQAIRDYHRWRRLGDATLAKRRQETDVEFEKSQEELARARCIVRKKPLPKPSHTEEHASTSGEVERLPSYPSEVRARRDSAFLSRARQRVPSYSRWPETLVLIFSLCTTLLLFAPLSLEPLPVSKRYDRAAERRYSDVSEYEMRPEVRQWANLPVEQAATAPSSPGWIENTVSPISMGDTLGQDWRILSDLQMPLAATYAAPSFSETLEVTISPVGRDNGRQGPGALPTCSRSMEEILPSDSGRDKMKQDPGALPTSSRLMEDTLSDSGRDKTEQYSGSLPTSSRPMEDIIPSDSGRDRVEQYIGALPASSPLTETSIFPVSGKDNIRQSPGSLSTSSGLLETIISAVRGRGNTKEYPATLATYSWHMKTTVPPISVTDNVREDPGMLPTSSRSMRIAVSSNTAKVNIGQDSGILSNLQVPSAATYGGSNLGYDTKTIDVHYERKTSRATPAGTPRHRPLLPGEVWHFCERCSQYHV